MIVLNGNEKSAMNGNKILLDSNVVIRLSKGDVQLIKFINESPNLLAVSVITYIEVLGYNFQNQTELNMIKDLFDVMEVIYLDAAITEKTIEIRKYRKIKLPDAIIAATALELGLTLITANFDDFKNIPQLKLLNR